MDETKKLAEMLGGFANNDSLLKQLSNIYRVPSFQDFARFEPPEMPKFPTWEERHNYESAGILIERLARRIEHWQASLPDDAQTVILAVMPSGATIRVLSLAQESHHGVAVTGLIEDNECLLLAHQSTLQLLCYVEKITAEFPRRPIGFHFQPPQATSSAEDE